MLSAENAYSAVTAVLPEKSVVEVRDALQEELHIGALMWDGRGTLLSEHRLRRWIPAISPAKKMLHLLAPSENVEVVERIIIENARLDKQSAGAVFSNPCSQMYFGADFEKWIQPGTAQNPTQNPVQSQNSMDETLSAILCIVGHQHSDKISRAAIDAGAHGPVVFYSEGRGLRDRLGWLRITKDHEQEVLLVIAEEDDADTIFDAMADAGQLHLPGRGIMYRIPISKGMFNLPSRIAHHHHDASMQQIIHAIDHLSGHQHWRDQSAFDVQGKGRAAGLNSLPKIVEQHNQVCLSVVVERGSSAAVMDTLLDAGAPGLNLNHAKFSVQAETLNSQGLAYSDEFTKIRCITGADTANAICKKLEECENHRQSNFCAYVNPAPRVATYVPGKKDYRAA